MGENPTAGNDAQSGLVEGDVADVDDEVVEALASTEAVRHVVVRGGDDVVLAVLVETRDLYRDPSLSSQSGERVPIEVFEVDDRLDVRAIRTDPSGAVVEFGVEEPEVATDGGRVDDERLDRLAYAVEEARREVEERAGDSVSVGTRATLGYVSDVLGGRSQ